jgi:hypothetical protein
VWDNLREANIMIQVARDIFAGYLSGEVNESHGESLAVRRWPKTLKLVMTSACQSAMGEHAPGERPLAKPLSMFRLGLISRRHENQQKV